MLQAAGTDLNRVVKTTVYLVDLADFQALNEVYADVFGLHKPTRSTVQVWHSHAVRALKLTPLLSSDLARA